MPNQKPAAQVRVIYVEYTSKYRAQIEAHLAPLLARLFPKVKMTITIVDNSDACEASKIPNTMVIKGDNSSREFSGWQTALDQLSFEPDDVICLCNDTFARNHGSEFLNWFQPTEVLTALENGKVVGYADSRRNESQLFGLPVRRWIRTSIIFIRGRDLSKILPLTMPVPDSEVFAVHGDSLFKTEAPIDASTRVWLNHWLVKGPTVPGESKDQWYLSETLNDKNRDFMNLKAKSILCEIFLSAKICSQGLQIFDVRRSRIRNFGAFYFLDRLGLLEPLQNLKRFVHSKSLR